MMDPAIKGIIDQLYALHIDGTNFKNLLQQLSAKRGDGTPHYTSHQQETGWTTLLMVGNREFQSDGTHNKKTPAEQSAARIALLHFREMYPEYVEPNQAGGAVRADDDNISVNTGAASVNCEEKTLLPPGVTSCPPTNVSPLCSDQAETEQVRSHCDGYDSQLRDLLKRIKSSPPEYEYKVKEQLETKAVVRLRVRHVLQLEKSNMKTSKKDSMQEVAKRAIDVIGCHEAGTGKDEMKQRLYVYCGKTNIKSPKYYSYRYVPHEVVTSVDSSVFGALISCKALSDEGHIELAGEAVTSKESARESAAKVALYVLKDELKIEEIARVEAGYDVNCNPGDTVTVVSVPSQPPVAIASTVSFTSPSVATPVSPISSSTTTPASPISASPISPSAAPLAAASAPLLTSADTPDGRAGYNSLVSGQAYKRKHPGELYSRLCEYCSQVGANDPQVTFSKEGELFKATIKVKCSFNFNESQKSKKEVEKLTARSVLQKLYPDSVPDHINKCKNKLQELSQKLEFDNVPEYHTTDKGYGFVSRVKLMFQRTGDRAFVTTQAAQEDISRKCLQILGLLPSDP